MSGLEDQLTPEILLNAYCHGIFPMAEHVNGDELFWMDPHVRGVIPLDDRFHVPRRLARTLRHHPYTIKCDGCFECVMRLCAEQGEDRPVSWINEEIIQLYTKLYEMGHAHSLEVWQGEELVGGLYGVHIGGAFFGESMFSRARDASKIALVLLVNHLRKHGFTLLDAQFPNDHLNQFGLLEIPREKYHALLTEALEKDCSFGSFC